MTFTVTPAANAAVDAIYKIAARLHDRRGDRLHGPHRAPGLARRGPLPALGQVARVRQLAREHRPGGARASAARRAVQTIAVGETFDAAGQRPQLVRRSRRAARSASTLPAELHRRRGVEAVRTARAGRRRDRHLHRDQHRRDDSRRQPDHANISRSRRPTRRAGPAPRRSRMSILPKTTIPPGAGRPDARRRRQRRRVRRLAARHRPDLGGRRQRAPRPARHRLRHVRCASAARRAPTPGSPAATTRCTSSSASATTSRPTRSRPRSASRTGWRTRSRS